MDFAKQQLLKFGWTEGKGLGKNEDGIVKPLKPKLKFDTAGVGNDSSELTFNWWENVFNNAADNIKVSQTKAGEVNIGLNTEESVNISTKKYIIKKKNKKSLKYGSFLQTSKLTAEGIIDYEDKHLNVVENVSQKVQLTDEDLFLACGGRTAHKGARHGLNLNGKLARLEQQEQELGTELSKQYRKSEVFLDDIKNMSTSEEDSNANDLYTKRKTKTKSENNEKLVEVSTSNDKVKKNKQKKRKRNHKSSNSINENVIFSEDNLEESDYKMDETISNKKSRKRQKRKEQSKEKMLSHTPEISESTDLVTIENVENKKIKLMSDEEGKSTKKSKMKNKKTNKNLSTNCKDDTQFYEFMNEVSEKISECKELRKKMKKEKRRLDDVRICKISEDLDKICNV